VATQMVIIPMTFSHLEGHFCCLKPFKVSYFGKFSHVLSTICLHMSEKVHMVCIFGRPLVKQFAATSPYPIGPLSCLSICLSILSVGL